MGEMFEASCKDYGDVCPPMFISASAEMPIPPVHVARYIGYILKVTKKSL